VDETKVEERSREEQTIDGRLVRIFFLFFFFLIVGLEWASAWKSAERVWLCEQSQKRFESDSSNANEAEAKEEAMDRTSVNDSQKHVFTRSDRLEAIKC
jgi:hypothetical protein